MADEVLSALERAERALQRIERTLANRPETSPSTDARDGELRARVREVVEELDVLIREAAT